MVVPLPGATGVPTTRSVHTTATSTTASASGSSASRTASGSAPTQSSGAGRVLISQGVGALGAAFALMLTL